GITALVYGVIEGDGAGWGSPEILGVLGLAAASLLLFVAIEYRAATPMVPLHFFRQRDFNGGVAILFLVFFALLGVMFFLSQFFQFVQGKSAFTAGLYMLPLAVALMVTAPLAGRMISVVGPRGLVLLSMGLSAGVLLFFTQMEIDSAYWPIGIALFFFGMGGGLMTPAVTDTIMASVPLHQAGRASGVSTTGRQIGGAVGIAVLGAVAATSYASGVSGSLAGVLPPDLVAEVGDGIGAAAVIARGADPGLAAVIEGAAFPAFVEAIRVVFWIGASFMALAGLAALLIPARMRSVQMGSTPSSEPASAVTASTVHRAAEMGLIRAHPQKVAAPAAAAGD
ncbi:MAG TPA: MFS transporter, partial [Dehalococcoidia bacterium]|nr:MFS transporter [Dehalococcoidia bacterium]